MLINVMLIKKKHVCRSKAGSIKKIQFYKQSVVDRQLYVASLVKYHLKKLFRRIENMPH